jgi:ABC-type transport system substrate-binding protein
VDEALQMTRLRAGEVDLLPGIPRAEYERVMNDPAEKAHVVQGTVNQTWYFGMNTTHKPWDNPKVRQAASLALRREAHVELAGPGQAARGVLPPHVPGYDASRTPVKQDVPAAKKLLAEAGYASGVPAALKTVMWLGNSDVYQRHGQAVQSDLAAVGIPVDLRHVTFKEYLKGYRDNADCWYGGWYPDYPDGGNFLEPVLHSRNIGPGKSNAAHYASKPFDLLLETAKSTPLGDARAALYKKADARLAVDLPWVPLYYEAETRWFREGVSGVKVHPVWRQKLTGISKR